jgi:hypothetical protein
MTLPSVVISHRDWMKLTDGGALVTRSTELKRVDAALKAYHVASSPATLDGLRRAFIQWTTGKGAGWKTSIRNKHKAVEALHGQIVGGTSAAVHAGDDEALAFARDESRAIVTKLFQGKELVFRPGLVTKLAGNGTLGKLGTKYTAIGVVRHVNTVSGGALADGTRQGARALAAAVPRSGSGGSGRATEMANALLREMVPSGLQAEVMRQLAGLMPSFMTELAASCAPFAGLLTTGGGVMVSAVTTLRAVHRVTDGQMHLERSLSTGDAEVAFKSLLRMLDRELNQEVASLARGFAEFTAKTAGFLADGGTVTNAAIGLASGVAKLLLLVRIVVRDVEEKNAANAILRRPTLDASLFQACPVMGAYLILCAPTSVLVNVILTSEEFYQPTMMPKVERAVAHHIEPLKEQAKRLVKEHRMYIPELQQYPGVLDRNKKELKRMLASRGKTTIGRDHLATAPIS